MKASVKKSENCLQPLECDFLNVDIVSGIIKVNNSSTVLRKFPV